MFFTHLISQIIISFCDNDLASAISGVMDASLANVCEILPHQWLWHSHVSLALPSCAWRHIHDIAWLSWAGLHSLRLLCTLLQVAEDLRRGRLVYEARAGGVMKGQGRLQPVFVCVKGARVVLRRPPCLFSWWGESYGSVWAKTENMHGQRAADLVHKADYFPQTPSGLVVATGFQEGKKAYAAANVNILVGRGFLACLLGGQWKSWASAFVINTNNAAL